MKLAIGDFDAILAAEPDQASTRFARASALLALDRCEEALADLDRVIELEPTGEIALHYLRGCADVQLERHREAIEDFGRVLALDPNDIHSLHNRAATYLSPSGPGATTTGWSGSNPATATPAASGAWRSPTSAVTPRRSRTFDRAIALDPRDADAYYERGLAHAALGEQAVAEKDFEQAARLAPDHAAGGDEGDGAGDTDKSGESAAGTG